MKGSRNRWDSQVKDPSLSPCAMRGRGPSMSSSIVLQQTESSVHQLRASSGHLPSSKDRAERELRLSHLQEGHLSRWDWRPDLCPLICSFLRMPSPLSQNKMKAGNRADAPLKTGHQQPRTPRGPQTAPLPKGDPERREGAVLWEGTSEDPC